MKEALALAKLAEEKDEVPVGALIILENQVIGRGINLRETSKRALAHAEILALEDFHSRSGQWRLPQGATLFVTAEPCLMCTGALIASRLTHLVYGCEDPKNAGLRRLQTWIDAGVFDHRFRSVQGGVLSGACAEILSSYFRKKRSGHTPLG